MHVFSVNKKMQHQHPGKNEEKKKTFNMAEVSVENMNHVSSGGEIQ